MGRAPGSARLICRRFAWNCLLSFTCALSPAHAMGVAEAARALGDLRDGNRANAIGNLVRTGQLSGPLSASEAAQVLNGTTQGARASAIAELSLVVKADLTGTELNAILGPTTDLTDGNRANAIAALARAKRFGPSIGGDAGPALNGATQGARATAISEMASYFRTDMRGQDVAAILGSAQVLSDGNRANAIAALARAGRMPRNTTGAEAELMLVGATQGARATAISEMATAFKSDLSGPEISKILGADGETTEGNRYNALAAVVRAGKVRGNLGTQDTGMIVQGMSGGTRAAALKDLANLPAGVAVAPTAPTPNPSASPPQFPEQNAGSTPPIIANASAVCNDSGTYVRQFCDLMRDVSERVELKLVDKANELLIRQTLVTLFRRLTPEMQRRLFSGKLSGIAVVQGAYTKTINKVMAAQKPSNYIDVTGVGLFCDFAKDVADEFVERTYLNGDPWTYAVMQGFSDQIYVGVCSMLSANRALGPQTVVLEAVVLEAQITALRLETIGFNYLQLNVERQNTVASWLVSMTKASASVVMNENALVPAGSRYAGFTPDRVIAVIRTSVANTDIPQFDTVARIVLEAQVDRLRAGGSNASSTPPIVSRAIATARRLDKQRSFTDKIFVTPFGSYEQAADTLLRMAGLL